MKINIEELAEEMMADIMENTGAEKWKAWSEVFQTNPKIALDIVTIVISNVALFPEMTKMPPETYIRSVISLMCYAVELGRLYGRAETVAEALAGIPE